MRPPTMYFRFAKPTDTATFLAEAWTWTRYKGVPVDGALVCFHARYGASECIRVSNAL